MSIRAIRTGDALPPRAPTPVEATKPTKPSPTTLEERPEEPSAFAKVLRGIGTEVARGESAVRGALRAGGNLGPGELLALQAGVYRYSEAVDLASKLVDRASAGVKTVLQGQ